MTHFPNGFRLPPANSFSTLTSYLIKPEVGRVGLGTELFCHLDLYREVKLEHRAKSQGLWKSQNAWVGTCQGMRKAHTFLTMAKATLMLARPGTIECWNPLLYIAPTKVCLIFVFFLARRKSTNTYLL